MRTLLPLALVAIAAVHARGQDTGMRPSIQEVKARYQNELLAQPGVVSVGIAEDAEGMFVIIVGMDRERPEVRREVPEELEGYSVRVEILGTIRAN